MKKVSVLIVDDSVVYRSQIRVALSQIQDVEVVGAASGGRLAIERMLQSPVDLVVMDLEMPEMDGLQTLDEMNRRGLTSKVLLFSSCSGRGVEITMDALRRGASDFIPKPHDSHDSASPPSEKIRILLEPKIRALFPGEESIKLLPDLDEVVNYPKLIWDFVRPQVVVVGSSTGGPTVLEKIFSQLAPPFNCPVLIAQHMPPVFTTTFAARLEKASGVKCSEAGDGMLLESNHIYVAPGNYHMRLKESAGSIKITLDQEPQIHSVRPAVDPLFESAAEIFKERCLGMILTGMGNDGRRGSEAVKGNRGAVVIQEETSCVVFGMPGAVKACGAYDWEASPDEIVGIFRDKVMLTGMGNIAQASLKRG